MPVGDTERAAQNDGSSDSGARDASDAMPATIGSDAFWAGIVRLFREGSLENLDRLSRDVARGIEAAWVELEQSG